MGYAKYPVRLGVFKGGEGTVSIVEAVFDNQQYQELFAELCRQGRVTIYHRDFAADQTPDQLIFIETLDEFLATQGLKQPKHWASRLWGILIRPEVGLTRVRIPPQVTEAPSGSQWPRGWGYAITRQSFVAWDLGAVSSRGLNAECRRLLAAFQQHLAM